MGKFAFSPKTVQTAKDVASTAGGVAKTFALGTSGSGSEKDIDYGPGPAPTTKTPPVDNAWYRSYGRYAPKR